MKILNKTKILLLVSLLSLILCATVGVSVTAAEEDNTPYATVLSKNLEYGDSLYLYFAIDDTYADGQEIEVLMYTENPTENSEATAYYASKSTTITYKPDPAKPVYRSFGIPAKAIVDTYYIVPHIVGQDIDYSKMETYSVIEYLLDMRLSSTDAIDTALYTALINYGAAAQNKFNYKTDTPATDYVYAEIVNGAFPDGTTSLLTLKGTAITLTYNGTPDKGYAQAGWNYTDSEGNTVNLSETNEITLNTSALLTPNMVNTYIITPDDLTGTRGSGVYYESSTKYGGSVVAPTPNANTASAVLYGDESDQFVYYYKDISEGETNGQTHILYENNVTVPTDTPTRILELDIAFGNFSNYTNESRVGTAGFQISFYGGAEQSTVYFVGNEGKISISNSTILAGENISLEEGKWYNLRLESYDYTTENNVATKAVKLYVDGVWMCDLQSADGGTSGAKNIRLTLRNYETDDWIAFDNVYIGYSADEFKEGAPAS